MQIMATIRLLIQALFEIRDALVGLHKIQVDRWISEGRDLSKKISGDTTDAQRTEDAKALSNHLSGL